MCVRVRVFSCLFVCLEVYYRLHLQGSHKVLDVSVLLFVVWDASSNTATGLRCAFGRLFGVCLFSLGFACGRTAVP